LKPQFSICIPNFNYGSYLPATLDSVLKQSDCLFEVVVADNDSTDDSGSIVQGYVDRDPRIRLRRNSTNVGFARNLDRAACNAKGDWMTMLSSDDLLDHDFLATYREIISDLGSEASEVILSTTQTLIDGQGDKLGEIGVDWKLWRNARKNERLSEIAGADVYECEAAILLRQSLQLMRTPFSFASTTYHRSLYEAVEGYSQTAIINPDKKFSWAILSKATKALVIDKPLVSYRTHNHNQAAQQSSAGALKHLTDQYIATFDLPNLMLDAVGLERRDLARAFVEHDIVLRSLLAVANGDRTHARRAIHFGLATYPKELKQNSKILALRLLLLLGPVGTWIAKRIKGSQIKRLNRLKGVGDAS